MVGRGPDLDAEPLSGRSVTRPLGDANRHITLPAGAGGSAWSTGDTGNHNAPTRSLGAGRGASVPGEVLMFGLIELLILGWFFGFAIEGVGQLILQGGHQSILSDHRNSARRRSSWGERSAPSGPCGPWPKHSVEGIEQSS
jgi:hypothetical protein